MGANPRAAHAGVTLPYRWLLSFAHLLCRRSIPNSWLGSKPLLRPEALVVYC